jgi:hypothetical protein
MPPLFCGLAKNTAHGPPASAGRCVPSDWIRRSRAENAGSKRTRTGWQNPSPHSRSRSQLLSTRGGSGGDRVALDRRATGDGRSSPRRRRMKHTPLHLFLFSFCSLSRHSVLPVAALRVPSPGGRWSLLRPRRRPATAVDGGNALCPRRGPFPFGRGGGELPTALVLLPMPPSDAHGDRAEQARPETAVLFAGEP